MMEIITVVQYGFAINSPSLYKRTQLQLKDRKTGYLYCFVQIVESIKLKLPSH